MSGGFLWFALSVALVFLVLPSAIWSARKSGAGWIVCHTPSSGWPLSGSSGRPRNHLPRGLGP